jgi:hypothetical protein
MSIEAVNGTHVPYVNTSQIINQTAIRITMAMLQAFMTDAELDLNTLCDKHIQPLIEQEIEGSDEKTQMVFQKLLMTTFSFAQKFPLLEVKFIGLNDARASGAPLFISSFVFPEAKALVETLEVQDPESLNDREIWQ